MKYRLDIYGNKIDIPKKCIHCNKSIDNHLAKTLACPMGSRTRIGYTSYYKDSFYSGGKK